MVVFLKRYLLPVVVFLNINEDVCSTPAFSTQFSKLVLWRRILDGLDLLANTTQHHQTVSTVVFPNGHIDEALFPMAEIDPVPEYFSKIVLSRQCRRNGVRTF